MLVSIGKSLPSGITIVFQNTSLQDYFEEIIDYEVDLSTKVPQGYFILTVRGHKIANYLCKPNSELLTYLVDYIQPTHLQFHIQYKTKKEGYLLAKQVNKYLTVWLGEIKLNG